MNLSTVPEALPLRAPGKSATAFRTIAEVAGDLDLPAHVLRFWESKFPQIKPLKRRGGRRYYRPEDVALLRRIRSLLYTEGYTIKGVQRLLREGGRSMPSADDGPGDGGPALAVADAALADATGVDPKLADATRPDANIRDTARAILAELEDLRALLRNHGF